MDDQLKHTPGPYELRPVWGTPDIAIHATETGECIGHLLSRSSGKKSAPVDAQALQNAELLRAAPEMRGMLEGLVNSEREDLDASTRDAIRGLVARIDAGPASRFLEEREREQTRHEELLILQVDEMARQSAPGSDGNDAGENEDCGPEMDW